MMVRSSVCLCVAALSLAALLGSSGCSDETGILVAVTGSSVDQLKFYVGVRDGADFVLDERSSGLEATVTGRNLRTRPYELLVSEPVPPGSDMELRVLALAFRIKDGNTSLYGYAITRPPQRFISGEVVRRPISIAALSTNVGLSALGESCFRVRAGDERFDIVSAVDRDCDGSATNVSTPDCNDNDSSVYPGARELCDGKDNNCDGKFAAAHVPCYIVEGARCLQGSRSCGDAQGTGLADTCVPTAVEKPALYCQAYTACTQPDPMACVNAIDQKTLSCTIEVAEANNKPCPAGVHTLLAPVGATECHWQSTGAGTLALKLKAEALGPARDIDACDVGLVIVPESDAPTGGPGTLQLSSNKGYTLYNVTLQVKRVAQCSATPLICR